MAGDTVIVLHNGSPYIGWQVVDVAQDFDDAAGEAKLTITEQPGNPLPMKLGDDVTIILGSTPVITGYVKGIQGRLTWNEHTIDVDIMDKTRFLIDSTIGAGLSKKIRPPVTLKQIAEETINHMGLPIGVIDKVGEEPFKEGELPQNFIDETGHAFIDKWASKRQALLNTDGKGNLVIDRNQMIKGPGMLFSGPEDNPLNNVLESQYSITDEGRHNATNAATQKSPNDLDYWETRPKGDDPAQAGPLSTAWGDAIDGDIRSERKLHYRAERGLNNQSPKKAAVWRQNVARARGYSYTAKVQGFEAVPGVLWWPGKTVTVADYHWLIAEELFIKGVRFHKDWDGGATTEISCTYKDGFSDKEGSSSSRTGSSGIGSP